jgi:hypothetical protein
MLGPRLWANTKVGLHEIEVEIESGQIYIYLIVSLLKQVEEKIRFR